MYKSRRNEWVQKNEWVWKKKHGLITGDCPVCCVHKGLCSFWGSFLGKRKVAVLAALNRLLNRWGPQCLGEVKQVTESHLDVLAYTATHGEAEEDCEAPSSTETSAEQQSK